MQLICILVFIYVIWYNLKGNNKKKSDTDVPDSSHSVQKGVRLGMNMSDISKDIFNTADINRPVYNSDNSKANEHVYNTNVSGANEEAYSTNETKMSTTDMETLKNRIKQRNNFSDDVNSNINNNSNHGTMQTLSQKEFHSPVMQAGSTGVYSDMKGGATFSHYECGHEYNDTITSQMPDTDKNIYTSFISDKNALRNAFIMQEILTRKGN